MVTKPKRQIGGIPRWASLLIYLLLSLMMTWPLVQNLNTHFGTSDTELFNVYWGNWWVRQALASGQNPYLTNYLIYPVGFNLTTFAFSPFLALLSIPLSWIASPIMAYNLLTWLTIVLCCVAMDQLVRYLTGNGWAALAAAVTFAFGPPVVAERARHLNMAFVVWLPWSALLLTRLMREAKIQDVILLAVVVGLSFLTRPQVGTLTLLFTGVYFLGLALVDRKRWHRLAFRRLLLAGVLGLVLLSPLLYLIWQALQQPGGESLLRGGAEELQTDLLAYVLPPPQHPIFGRWTEPIYQERFAINIGYWAYVGFAALLLAIYAAISRPRKALPWLLTGLVFFLLALGPYLRLNGNVYPGIKLPYGIAPGLFSVIGFDVPNRLNLAVMAAVSVLVGLACAQLAARFNRSWLPAIAALLIVGEYLVAPLPLMAAPSHSPFYDQMAADGEEYAIVDLPLTREEGEVHRFYQTLHHKPIVGGWDYRVPPSAFDFIDSNPLLAPWRGTVLAEVTLDQALGELFDANVRYFVLHKDQVRTVLPQETRELLFALKPIYDDDTIYVLPVEATSPEAYQIVHWFEEQTGLVRPTLYLAMPMRSEEPQLFLDVCWWLGPEREEGDRYQVALTTPDGVPLTERTASLRPGSEGLACQRWPLEIAPSFQAGEYTLSITVLSREKPLDTYSAEVPLHVFENRTGTLFPALGVPFGVTYEAPIELLGYYLAGGDGYLWLDLYWLGLEKHFQAYFLTLYLLDQRTGQIVVSSRDMIPKLEWRDGDLLQVRRVLWIRDTPQGQYSLGIAVQRWEGPGEQLVPFDAQSGEPWPEAMALLDTPVLILPADLRQSPIIGDGRILAYSRVTELGTQPEHPVSVHFGEVAELTSYRLAPEEAKVGDDLQLTLLWQAINNQPLTNDFTVFVHLLDESGQLIAQHDGEPVAGRRPTHTWQEGDLIIDTHRLQWTTEAYAGTATPVVGLYDPETMERLPAYGPDGQRLADDRAILPEIQVR